MFKSEKLPELKPLADDVDTLLQQVNGKERQGELKCGTEQPVEWLFDRELRSEVQSFVFVTHR